MQFYFDSTFATSCKCCVCGMLYSTNADVGCYQIREPGCVVLWYCGTAENPLQPSMERQHYKISLGVSAIVEGRENSEDFCQHHTVQ